MTQDAHNSHNSHNQGREPSLPPKGEWPLCPFCYSPCMPAINHKRAIEYRWGCGAWAGMDNFMVHGAGAVVSYDSACDYIEALRAAKSMIEQNHPRKVDYKGMLIGGGGHGKIEETYEKICAVLP